MPIQGEYMGMMLTVDDVDSENREFFRYCAAGDFRLQRGTNSKLLRYPPTTACPWTGEREFEWVPVDSFLRAKVESRYESFRVSSP